MYISKSILDAHKGQIFVHSQGENRGSTFTMLLPVIKPALEPTNSNEESSFQNSNNIRFDEENNDQLKDNSHEMYCINQTYNFSSNDNIADEILDPFHDTSTERVTNQEIIGKRYHSNVHLLFCDYISINTFQIGLVNDNIDLETARSSSYNSNNSK